MVIARNSTPDSTIASSRTDFSAAAGQTLSMLALTHHAGRSARMRAAAMQALAAESDHAEMALMAAAEFDKVAQLFARAPLACYQQLATERRDAAQALVKLLEV